MHLGNGLLFSELAKPNIIKIPLHALTKITQRNFTASSQSNELEILNHTTVIQKQLAQFKLTEETGLLATKTRSRTETESNSNS